MLRVLPAVVFVALAILIPIVTFLYQAVDNSEVTRSLPRTTVALQHWDRDTPPAEPLFDALVADLNDLGQNPELFSLARRLNYFEAGFRPLFLEAAKALEKTDSGASPREILSAANPRWLEAQTWQTLKNESSGFTPYFLLAAFDLQIDGQGQIASAETDRAIFVDIFTRTVWMSLLIAGSCVLLGYPVAYLLANTQSRWGRLALYAVLLPFWTSLLVRTVAWIVIFQRGGIASSINALFGGDTTSFLNTRPAVIIGMIHVMLPFMILSIYAVLRGIPRSYMRAAISLGAHPVRAFFGVYLPQSAPGIGAGIMIVTILSLGFYLTPALLGSPSDQLISYFIAFYINESLNWSMASALSVWLLVLAFAFFLIVHRTIGVRGR